IYKGDPVERNRRLLAGSTTEKTFTQGGKKVFYDLWSLNGEILTITDGRGGGYGPSKEDGPYFKIKYKYADTYDPRFTFY
ncbi:uncharacterized protein METZ01_LOCUS489081, partial [marine metagenome]